MKNKRHGFSMIELLAAIVILGLLMSVAIVGVSRILANAKENYYKALLKQMRLAGESYTQDNRNYLPKKLGGKTNLGLKTLEDKKYIDEVMDYQKNRCYNDKSYVQVFKYSKNEYTYLPHLECPNYNSGSFEQSDLAPDITIKYLTSAEGDSQAKFTITILGDYSKTVKLLGYKYIVYLDDKELINSGEVEANYKLSKEIKLDLSKYTPATIKVKVTATNIYGITATETVKNKFKDANPPKCTNISGQSTTWTKSDRTISVDCEDGLGSGCEFKTYTKTFNKDTKQGTITISDNEGNKTSCKVDAYVDKTTPTCNLNVTGTKGQDNWYKSSPIKVTLEKNDNLSGIDKYDLTKSTTVTYTGTDAINQGETNGTIFYGYVKDVAGNEGKCSKSVAVDSIKPTCTITKTGTNGLNSWYKANDVTLTLNTTDTGGVAGYDLKNTNSVSYNNKKTATQSDTKGITWYGFTKDKAGNTNTCNTGNFKVDKTNPTAGTFKITGTLGNDNWYTSNVTIGVNSGSDATSGHKETNVSPTSITSDTKGTTATIKTLDNAGNESKRTTSIKLDKTSPSVSFTVKSRNNDYNTKNIDYTISATDGTSGVDKYCFKVGAKCTPNTTTTSKDNVDIGFDSYDGSSKTLYACVSDKAGNVTCKNVKYTVNSVNIDILKKEYTICPEDQNKPTRDKCLTGQYNTLYIDSVTKSGVKVNIEGHLHSNNTAVTYGGDYTKRYLCVANSSNKCIYEIKTFDIASSSWVGKGKDFYSFKISLDVTNYSSGDYRVIMTSKVGSTYKCPDEKWCFTKNQVNLFRIS